MKIILIYLNKLKKLQRRKKLNKKLIDLINKNKIIWKKLINLINYWKTYNKNKNSLMTKKINCPKIVFDKNFILCFNLHLNFKNL